MPAVGSDSREAGAVGARIPDALAPSPRILLIDNYDSFTYNLVHQIAATAGRAPVVVHNDWAGWSPSVLDGFDAVVLSPGPGDPRVPADFGICADAIRIAAERRIPLLGVCLGHQGLGHAYGAAVRRAPEPRHGRPSPVFHDGTGPFEGLPSPVEVIRYHSLLIDDVPDELVVTARADDGVIMGIRHRELPLWGVQFHPESIGTHDGTRMMANFVALVRDGLVERGRAAGTVDVQTPETRPCGPSPRAILRRTLTSAVDTETLFTELFGDAAQAVWLDGNRRGDDRARYSILGGGDDLPTAVADVREGTVTLTEGGHVREVRSGFFDWLDAELSASVVEAGDVPFALGWVGALGYELRAECGSPHDRRAATPDALLVRLDRALVVDHQEDRIHLLARDDAGWIDRVAARIEALDDRPAPEHRAHDRAAVPVLTARHSRERYLALIAAAQEEIAAGETYEACLTNLLHGVGGDGVGDPLAAYLALRRQNPAPFAAFLRIAGVSVLSTSPERFVRITADGAVESSPIKGTRPRGADEGEDERIRAELAAAEKDRAENLMIVDLVRHDLGRTAELGSVHVDGLFRVESYATVHQLVSTVRSTLAATPVACVRAAFPPGSMTGAPKLRTMAILDRLEGGARGFYSGALGYFSFDGSVDLSVVIRTMIQQGEDVDYGVGGAIVSLSDPDDEYAETAVKARPLLRLTGAEFPEG
ncbi:aminodeoxychorismate synthase component I [Microbacterium azadirachtae]|uniref:aminodeoxychorismate synthase component I n=1 Tax=Microbacterium azadirachtae TaxID=582680 RepID=UPI000889CE25|nr:aminodeoxychorismate synthase component I [Microbacterium azadirachtae]SDM06501.1 para-aminobenzoate synthetase [Microbacterium azadirachtae]SEG31690.1 para-aminobenzoate synthetase [Microbacterium azadirachtae]SEG34864.1 para-aminobenzoate synthetase [Microbacterium azadirachtae]